jgi:hypothetical protein
LIGGNVVETHLSNPNPTDNKPTHDYHNVNLLGMSFLRKFKGYRQEGDFAKNLAILELIK